MILSKILRFFAALVFAAATMFAQSPREMMAARTLALPALVTGGFLEPHWMEDGNSFWYAEGSPVDTVIYKYDPVAEKKALLFDTARVRTALTPLVGHELPYKGLPFGNFSFLPGEKSVRFSFEGRGFTMQLDSYAITPLPPESEPEKDRRTPHFVRKGLLAGMPDVYEILSPDGRWYIGSKDGNLYLRSTIDGRSEALTDDGIKDDVWDSDGTLWAPNSLSLVARKADMRDMPLYPIVHWLKPREEVEWVRLGKTGAAGANLEYYVIDVMSKKKVRIETGSGELQLLIWRPDGSELLLLRQGLKKLDFLAANPRTGATRMLFTETTNTFFDLALSLPNTPNFTLLGDNRRFLWLSERDGWNQIYLYDLDGKLIRKLTDDKRPVVRVSAVDEKNGWVYYTAHGGEGRPYDFQLYRVSMEGGKAGRLSEAPGQHDQSVYFSWLGRGQGEGIRFSPSRQFFLDSHSDVNDPPQTELRRADGRLVEVLSKAKADIVKILRPHPPEEFTVKAADGQTDLYGIIYKPFDFDPNKKYPVVDAIYAGPQTTWVSRTYTGGSGVQDQALAHLGFIIVSVDARGTPDRGKAFQDVVYGNFGRNEIPDHVAVLKQLAASRPFMDMSRVGVFGGSYGGYFTIRAMLLAPDFYHVGVANAPITTLLQVPGQERYMGSPQENKEGYEYGSNLQMAANLKGHLMLIHGTSDINAPFTATIQLIDAFVRAGKPYDLVVLPEQNHWLTGPSGAYYFSTLKRYLEEHLKP